MTKFVRRSRRHHAVWLTTGYVVLSMMSGAASDPLGRLLFAEGVSPISSASAVAILSAIASGMMALTAIAFSLVFVAVQLGNTSYSPRLLAVLSDDYFQAHALGIFSGTFVYALLAIRHIDLTGAPGINIAVILVAFVWLLASVTVLVCLLPRIRGLAISEVLIGLQQRACAAADRVYPVALAEAHQTQAPALSPVSHVIRYVGPPRHIIGFDLESLVTCAVAAEAQLVVPGAIGDELIDGDPLVIVHGGTYPVGEEMVRQAIWLARERAVDNDPAYAIRLLVDIAIRGLSPAVNDPTTAVNVLGELDGILRLLGKRLLDDSQARDTHGDVRVVRAVASWDDLVELALTEIHQYGRDAFQVQRRLSAMLRDLPAVLPAERRPVFERFASWRAHDAQTWIDPWAIDRQGIGHRVH